MSNRIIEYGFLWIMSSSLFRSINSWISLIAHKIIKKILSVKSMWVADKRFYGNRNFSYFFYKVGLFYSIHCFIPYKINNAFSENQYYSGNKHQNWIYLTVRQTKYIMPAVVPEIFNDKPWNGVNDNEGNDTVSRRTAFYIYIY